MNMFGGIIKTMDTKFLKAKTILGVLVVVLLILIGVSVFGKNKTNSPGTRVIPITAPEIIPTDNISEQQQYGQLPDYPFTYQDLNLELNNMGTILRVDFSGEKSSAEAKVQQLLTEYNIDTTNLEIVFIGLDQDSNEPPPGFGQGQ
ncbi:hypothetical protein CO050_00250 [Candidatus Roizmanbacteria bacterium CG_4_9_14_0_2_um_filter_38_17]|nr:MAG: hypothetical protein CO050_00250 [Candidatus Roizmanbacteria bacterium CG_4_9_14_0_2_um_filter_38_17]